MKCFVFTLILIGYSWSYAACSSPAGVVGEFKYIVNSPDGTVKFCDGTSWLSIETSDTAASCTEPGAIRYNTAPTPKRLEFCGGNTVTLTYTWRSANGDTSGAGGACATSGKFEYDSGISKPRFCEAGTYRLIGGSAILTSPESAGVGSATTGTVTIPITIENTGTYASSTISATLGGADAGWFTITANTCTTLAPATTCTIDIEFPGNWYGGAPKVATITVSATSGGTLVIPLEDCTSGGCTL